MALGLVRFRGRLSFVGHRISLGAAAIALLGIVHASPAFAYCRTTTCDDDEHACEYDENGCLITGQPLAWPDKCVSFGVHTGGSALRGISAEKAAEALRRAFQTWISVDCGDGRHPSLGVVARGEVHCDEVEYNHDATPADGDHSVDGPNANILVFRDDVWEHVGDSQDLAVTTVTYSEITGEILDADIEVNTFETEFTTGEDVVKADLQAVLTHEVGHFLGLGHSMVPGATMNRDYDSGSLDFRSISEDDRRAICAAYPPLEPVAASGVGGGAGLDTAIDCAGESPRFGFSRYCGEPVLADGCAVSRVGRQGRSRQPVGALLGVLGCALFIVRNRARSGAKLRVDRTLRHADRARSTRARGGS